MRSVDRKAVGRYSQGGRIKCVEWLLRHRLIVQLHYYYYLLLPNDDRADFKEEYKRTRLPRPRAPIVRLLSEAHLLCKSSTPMLCSLLQQRRQQYSSDIFGSSSKCERFCMTSENIDIRGNVLSINGFEYPMGKKDVGFCFVSFSSVLWRDALHLLSRCCCVIHSTGEKRGSISFLIRTPVE